jgi:23S rRNA pseudouridine2457 synthase
MNENLNYYIIYKPFGMLSQFSEEGGKTTLASLGKFPKDIYPVGRLDSDSEGLLILTNDKGLNHRLLNPKFKHQRTYLAQVEGSMTVDAVTKLNHGVSITVEGKIYQTLPAKATILPLDPVVPDRNPPIRFRKNIPTSWISLTLFEGKNRQVRKMTAAAGFPTLRLIRKSIEGIELGDMQPGDVIELPNEKIYELLFRK